MFACAYACMYACMYVCAYVCMNACVYTRMYVTYAYIYVHNFMYINMYMRARAHTHTHTHTHTHQAGVERAAINLNPTLLPSACVHIITGLVRSRICMRICAYWRLHTMPVTWQVPWECGPMSCRKQQNSHSMRKDPVSMRRWNGGIARQCGCVCVSERVSEWESEWVREKESLCVCVCVCVCACV